MMQELGSWIIPLTFIPAVGLIIMSTSARFSALSVELNKLLAQQDANPQVIKKQIKRSRLFNNALVSLYVAVASFSMGALLGGLSEQLPDISHWALMISVCMGVLCLVFSSIQLIIESIIARQVLETQCGTMH